MSMDDKQENGPENPAEQPPQEPAPEADPGPQAPADRGDVAARRGQRCGRRRPHRRPRPDGAAVPPAPGLAAFSARGPNV